MSDKRERMLQGMLEVVGERGYQEASVQDTISRAGLYRQVFYDSFKDKEDAFLQAIDMGIGQIESAMREGAAGKSSWRDQLRGALLGLLRFLDENPEIGRALVVEMHAAGPPALAKRIDALRRAEETMEGAREEGLRNAPPISAEVVVAEIFAVIHTRLATHQTSGLVSLLPELMYLAVLPYFGPDAAAAEMRTAATQG